MVDSGLSELPSDVIRNGLNDVFLEKLQTENFKVRVESGSKSGDNFIGVVYRVTGEKILRDDADESEKGASTNKLRLILKVAPQSLSRRERFFSRPCFLREIFIYNEVNTPLIRAIIFINQIVLKIRRFWPISVNCKNRMVSISLRRVSTNTRNAIVPSTMT